MAELDGIERVLYFLKKWKEKISINFAGVYMDSYIHVNGKNIGNHPYGYAQFSFDIT
jgi:beta-galactosidase/beta-glucuronidase